MEFARGADLNGIGLYRLISTKESIQLRLRGGAGAARRQFCSEDISHFFRRRGITHWARLFGRPTHILCRPQEFRMGIAHVFSVEFSRPDGPSHAITQEAVFDRGLWGRGGGSWTHSKDPTGTGAHLLEVIYPTYRYIDLIY